MCVAGLLWFASLLPAGICLCRGFVAGTAGPGYLVDGPLYQLLSV
jgi:hypothetical protein